MAEAPLLSSSYDSLDNALRIGLSNSLATAKEATLNTGKKITNYCSMKKGIILDGVRNPKDFNRKPRDGCLGKLLFSWRNQKSNDWDEEDEDEDDEGGGAREASSLLPGPSSGRYRRLDSLPEEASRPRKKPSLQHAVNIVTEKVSSAFQQAGCWLVKGLQGYADAVNPQGIVYDHNNVLHMYPCALY